MEPNKEKFFRSFLHSKKYFWGQIEALIHCKQFRCKNAPLDYLQFHAINLNYDVMFSTIHVQTEGHVGPLPCRLSLLCLVLSHTFYWVLFLVEVCKQRNLIQTDRSNICFSCTLSNQLIFRKGTLVQETYLVDMLYSKTGYQVSIIMYNSYIELYFALQW